MQLLAFYCTETARNPIVAREKKDEKSIANLFLTIVHGTQVVKLRSGHVQYVCEMTGRSDIRWRIKHPRLPIITMIFMEKHNERQVRKNIVFLSDSIFCSRSDSFMTFEKRRILFPRTGPRNACQTILFLKKKIPRNWGKVTCLSVDHVRKLFGLSELVELSMQYCRSSFGIISSQICCSTPSFARCWAVEIFFLFTRIYRK